MESKWNHPGALEHAQHLVRSYAEVTGRELIPHGLDSKDLAVRLFHAPFVVVSHGVEIDPVH